MHPEDVRDFVAECYSELCAALTRTSELGVTKTELDDVDIYIAMTVGQAATTPIDPALASQIGVKTLLVAVAPGQYEQRVYGTPVVPDLGQLAQRELLLRVGCDDFDGQPPLAELLNPSDRSPLPDEEWPKDGSGRGIVADHPMYKRRFFCRPGFREFHEHPEHEDHPWDQIRAESTLAQHVVGLIHDLKFRWRLS